MAVEARLIEKLGPLGGALHAARSRNDQIATDLRLWLRERIFDLDHRLKDLMGALLDRVETDGEMLIPGFTHLQRGQPIFMGHHLLAHTFALSRDRDRLAGALARVDRSPLGACAMAGTPHPIDREETAELLGFPALMENAMDAVAARDHVLETVAVLSILAIHLSRMAEELVLWASSEFALARLSPAYSSGSSIMPQKRNPDAAELIRGHAGRSSGALVGLLTLVKGLPLAYNRDLQEERVHLFAAVDSTMSCLEILRGVYATMEFRRDRYEEVLRSDPSLATEIADFLVSRGMPFREAHERVGVLVANLERRGLSLQDLEPQEASALHLALTPEVLRDLLDPRGAAERRRSRGGTALEEQARQAALLRESIS
jgi:argininosuccinate lyase